MNFPTFNSYQNNIHFWIFDIELLYDTPLQHKDLLSKEERLRMMKLATPRLKENFLFSHSLLKLILAKYLKCSPGEIKYRFGMYKKPFVFYKGKSLEFNMSHSNERIAYVFSDSGAVGVDIEEQGRELLESQLSSLIFNIKEQIVFKSIPCSEKRKSYFLQVWTAKEAFLKMLGIGIGDFLKSVYFDNSWNAYLPGMVKTPKSFEIVGKVHHILTEQYVASIAFSNHFASLEVIEIQNLSDLMS